MSNCQCRTCQEATLHRFPETAKDAALRRELYYDYYDAYLDLKDYNHRRALEMLSVARGLSMGRALNTVPCDPSDYY